MKKNFDFNGLFIYDLANNHEGSLEHGIEIIKSIGKVSKKHGVRGVFKFQFRHIDTLIHPDYKNNKEIMITLVIICGFKYQGLAVLVVVVDIFLYELYFI